MNKAQKRTWCKLAVSVLGLLFMSGALTIMKIYNLEMRDPQDHTAIRILGMFNTIPFILIAIIDWRWKKVYDERDLQIELNTLRFGIIGSFTFLAAAGLFLMIKTKCGFIKANLITSLVVLSVYVGLLISSAAALILYGRGGKENE